MEVRRFVFRRGVNMEDRISTYPGRIKLTAVSGETDTYDLTRADSPTVVGTPLNKATFLTDTTTDAIEALGGTEPTLPDEALALIASLLAGMGVSNVAHVEYGSYIGDGTHGSSHKNTLALTYKPLFFVVLNPSRYFGDVNANGYEVYVKGASESIHNYFSVSGSTITWYSKGPTTSAEKQMNVSGTTYYYLSIGEL